MINFKDFESEKRFNDLQREFYINKTLNELLIDLNVCKLMKQFNKIVSVYDNLKQENKQLKDKLIEINEVINGYMPNQYAMCKAFDEIEFIISKGVE